MVITDIDKISEALVGYLHDGKIDGRGGFKDIYMSESVPVTKLPESFLEVRGNGPVSTNLSQYGMGEFNLSVVQNVKLRTDGTRNLVREAFLSNLVYKAFSDESGCPKVVTIDRYHYSLNKRNMVYSGRELLSGYSSRIININVKIY